MENPVVVQEGYEGGKPTVEWIHEMPKYGEIVIRTNTEKWHLSIDNKDRLEIRCSNRPGGPANRILVSPLSANLVALETVGLGT